MTLALLVSLTYFRVAGVLWGIAAGPDGNLWFPTTNGVARMTTGGDVTVYAAGPISGGRAMIAAGPDGRMWFTEPNEHRVGAVTMSGAVTEYALPADAIPMGIAAGADGNVWFGTGNAVGRITPGGGVTLFPLGGHAEVFDLVAGGDGNVWFVEWPQNAVGRITPEGTVTQFPTPCCGVQSIARGDDGALWLASDHAILRTTTDGAVTVPRTTTDFLTTIANGPGGTIWFGTEGPRLGDVDGDVVNLAPEVPRVDEIVAGPDGNLWATLDRPPIACTLICPPADPNPPLSIVRVNLHPSPRRRAVHSR